MEHGEDAGGGDQGDEAVQRGDAGADHAAGGTGAVLGDVDQPPEVGVVDGLQFHARLRRPGTGWWRSAPPCGSRRPAREVDQADEGGVDDADGGGGQQAG